MEIALIENIQRENLNPIEEAEAFEQIIKTSQITQDEAAKKFGKSRSYITNILGLLRLPERTRKYVTENKITMGHARALSKLSDADEINSLAERIVKEGLSVRETENLVKGVINVLNGKDIDKDGRVVADTKKDEAMEAILAQVADDLKMTLGTKVNVKAKGKKGKIEIEYKNADDLERISHVIKGAN